MLWAFLGMSKDQIQQHPKLKGPLNTLDGVSCQYKRPPLAEAGVMAELYALSVWRLASQGHRPRTKAPSAAAFFLIAILSFCSSTSDLTQRRFTIRPFDSKLRTLK